MLALSVTEPGEQNVVEPPAVIVAVGGAVLTVTVTLLDNTFPQLLLITHLYVPDVLTCRVELISPDKIL